MRFPGQEHDRFLGADRTLDLREHALFARFDELEIPKMIEILLEHLEHVAVAVVAGFDAVDRMIQRTREALDVGEVMEARFVGVGRHGQCVFRAREIGADFDDRAVGDVLAAIRLLRRHPIAEEHVNVLVLQRCERDRHGQHGDLRRVAELLQECGRERRGRGHVGPADVGEAHGTTARRVGAGRRYGLRRSQAAEQGQS